MHSEKLRLFQISLVLSDMAVITLSFFVSFWLRSSVLSDYLGPLYPLQRYLWVYFVAVISLPLILTVLRHYQTKDAIKTMENSPSVAGRVLQGVIFEYAIVSALGFTLRLHDVSRLLTFLFLLLCGSLLLWSRVLVWPVLFRRIQREPLIVVIVGTGETAMQLLSVLADRSAIRTTVLGFLAEKPIRSNELEGYPVLGSLDDSSSILSKHVVDEVLVGLPEKSLKDLEPLLLTCEEQGITVRLSCDVVPHVSSRICLTHFNGVPLLTFTTSPNSPNLLAIKRVMDLSLSLVLLVLTLPLFLLFSVLIKLTSKGKVFYRQTRCGLNGRRFTFVKFRSMVEGADEIRKNLEHLNEAARPIFKISSDPRVTKLGRFLRRTSIDELPQLFNVLRGEMSLVGPRPPLPEEVRWYMPWQQRRLSMKPGITCLWQVSGRSELSFKEWVDLDLQYIDNWSLWLDIKILLMTIPAVLFRKGAW